MDRRVIVDGGRTNSNVQYLIKAYNTPASPFNLATSVSTLSTTTPPFLVGGSSTDKTLFLGDKLIPRSAAFTVSMGFFLAYK